MWLVYDWQSAVVVNAQGDIVDSMTIQGLPSSREILVRINQIQSNERTEEAEVLHSRFPDAQLTDPNDTALPAFSFPEPTQALLSRFDEAVLLQTNIDIQQKSGHPDRRLEHMLRANDESREFCLTLENRCIEWFGDLFPHVEMSKDRRGLLRQLAQFDTVPDVAQHFNVEASFFEIDAQEWLSFKALIEQLLQSQKNIDKLENVLRKLAQEYLPSVSLLLGPLLAARMCVEAHGRQRLAMLPSGTIQVLGAEKAFFHHLKTGAPPPKHGHIFMHPWISHSPRWVRGKISRMLASKVSIAAKVDAFQGQPWSEEDIQKIADCDTS